MTGDVFVTGEHQCPMQMIGIYRHPFSSCCPRIIDCILLAISNHLCENQSLLAFTSIKVMSNLGKQDWVMEHIHDHINSMHQVMYDFMYMLLKWHCKTDVMGNHRTS